MIRPLLCSIALTIICVAGAIAGNLQQSLVQPDSVAKSDNRFSFRIYGFVRNDFTYDSRKTIASVGELFNFIPYDQNIGADGQDLNSVPSTRFLAVTSRVGFDVKSPMYNKFFFTAKIEADFCGSGATVPVLRIRQANFGLNWSHHQLILGQTWHPMSDMIPTIVSLNTGAPFNPFSRTPLIRYDVRVNDILMLSAAVVYQFQYTSPGPELTADGTYKTVNSVKFQVFGGLPEFYLGATLKKEKWTAGIGAEYFAIRPFETYNDKLVTSKVHSFAGQLFLGYVGEQVEVKAKTVLGQNLGHLLMMSGYGVCGTSKDNLENITYSPLAQSSTWATIAYKTNNVKHNFRTTLFGGYIKNLGASSPLVVDMVFVRGFKNIDQIFRVSPSVMYSYKDFDFGAEYEYTGVFYGVAKENFSVTPTHIVGNHRAYVLFRYNFSHLFR